MIIISMAKIVPQIQIQKDCMKTTLTIYWQKFIQTLNRNAYSQSQCQFIAIYKVSMSSQVVNAKKKFQRTLSEQFLKTLTI